MKISEFAKRFYQEQEGATATEYILLVVFIAIVMAGGAWFFGDSLGQFFQKTGTEVNSINPVLPTGPGDLNPK